MNSPEYEVTIFDKSDKRTPTWKLSGVDDEFAFLRLTSGDGKSELDDLLRAIVGMTYGPGEDHGHYKLIPADAVRVMSAFRLLGAEDRLIIELPQQYLDIVEKNADRGDDQVREAEELRWAQIGGGTLRKPRD